MRSPRADYPRLVPEVFRALLDAGRRLHAGSLGPELADLVFLRVSQINGCAYCIDMHATALRKGGIDARKLAAVPAWRETRFFEARERAALAWAEALTTLPQAAPPDATYDALAEHFDDLGIAELTLAVAIVNSWNRLGVGLRPPLP